MAFPQTDRGESEGYISTQFLGGRFPLLGATPRPLPPPPTTSSPPLKKPLANSTPQAYGYWPTGCV